MLTVANMHGAGGDPAIPVTVEQQETAAKDARAALVKAASELPESAFTKALLDMLTESQAAHDEYRTGLATALDAMGGLELHLGSIRQKMLTARMSEPDDIMKGRLANLTPIIDGLLDRFREIHRHLSAVEDGLVPLERGIQDALGWAVETDYIPERAVSGRRARKP